MRVARFQLFKGRQKLVAAGLSLEVVKKVRGHGWGEASLLK